MDFEKLVLNRQSDRRYLPDSVDRKDIEKCLEAARMAPSACNSQPWKFVVVDDREKLEIMAEAAEGFGMNKFAKNAPVIVAVVLEKMNASARLGSLIKRKDYCMLDLGMAVEHFCLQAADLGLGTCIMGWFDERRVSRLLNIPGRKRIPLLISLGHPNNMTRRKVRKPVEEISSWNSY
jgi:nitroreductase